MAKTPDYCKDTDTISQLLESLDVTTDVTLPAYYSPPSYEQQFTILS